MPAKEGRSEAIILAKGVFQASPKHKDTIYCAGVTAQGEWVRLYPVTFGALEDAQRFGQWSRIEFDWHMPSDDPRVESRRLNSGSIKIIGEVSPEERHKLLSKLEVSELKSPAGQGKTLALLRPRNPYFIIERKLAIEVVEEHQAIELVAGHKKLSGSKIFMPLPKYCPYKFKYKYYTDDGEQESVYQDLDIGTTFSSWSKRFGEEHTLSRLRKIYGEEYLKKNMTFVMGRSSISPHTWFINSIICMDDVYSITGNQYDLVV